MADHAYVTHDVLMRFFVGYIDGQFHYLLVTAPERPAPKEPTPCR